MISVSEFRAVCAIALAFACGALSPSPVSGQTTAPVDMRDALAAAERAVGVSMEDTLKISNGNPNQVYLRNPFTSQLEAPVDVSNRIYLVEPSYKVSRSEALSFYLLSTTGSTYVPREGVTDDLPLKFVLIVPEGFTPSNGFPKFDYGQWTAGRDKTWYVPWTNFNVRLEGAIEKNGISTSITLNYLTGLTEDLVDDRGTVPVTGRDESCGSRWISDPTGQANYALVLTRKDDCEIQRERQEADTAISQAEVSKQAAAGGGISPAPPEDDALDGKSLAYLTLVLVGRPPAISDLHFDPPASMDCDTEARKVSADRARLFEDMDSTSLCLTVVEDGAPIVISFSDSSEAGSAGYARSTFKPDAAELENRLMIRVVGSAQKAAAPATPTDSAAIRSELRFWIGGTGGLTTKDTALAELSRRISDALLAKTQATASVTVEDNGYFIVKIPAGAPDFDVNVDVPKELSIFDLQVEPRGSGFQIEQFDDGASLRILYTGPDPATLGAGATAVVDATMYVERRPAEPESIRLSPRMRIADAEVELLNRCQPMVKTPSGDSLWFGWSADEQVWILPGAESVSVADTDLLTINFALNDAFSSSEAHQNRARQLCSSAGEVNVTIGTLMADPTLYAPSPRPVLVYFNMNETHVDSGYERRREFLKSMLEGIADALPEGQMIELFMPTRSGGIQAYQAPSKVRLLNAIDANRANAVGIDLKLPFVFDEVLSHAFERREAYSFKGDPLVVVAGHFDEFGQVCRLIARDISQASIGTDGIRALNLVVLADLAETTGLIRDDDSRAYKECSSTSPYPRAQIVLSSSLGSWSDGARLNGGFPVGIWRDVLARGAAQ